MDPTQQGALSAGLPNDILVVEDDALIALDVRETLLELGVPSVRSAASVARALAMISERAPDFALLDVELIHEKSFAVAERLETLKIPFVFTTGYSDAMVFPPPFAGRPTLNKPYQHEALRDMLDNWRSFLK